MHDLRLERFLENEPVDGPIKSFTLRPSRDAADSEFSGSFSPASLVAGFAGHETSKVVGALFRFTCPFIEDGSTASSRASR